MWWRFLAFCVLVSLVLFIVLSCVYGRPVVHLFFHRCCEENIENDQVIFENFGNNFLRERLVGAEELGNGTFLENIEKAIDGIGQLMNVHNPSTRDLYDDLVEELNLDNTDEMVYESTTEIERHEYIGRNAARDAAKPGTITKKQKSGFDTHFDVLIDGLQSHSWPAEEKPCLDQILQTIHNVKNATLWATWMWDSTQLPAGYLYGSKYHFKTFDQCLSERVGAASPPFRTQYCLANVILLPDKSVNLSTKDIDPYSPTEEYIRSKTALNQKFNELFWGVCVPHSCQVKSVQNFVRTLLEHSHLGSLQPFAEVNIESCEAVGDAKNQVDGFVIVLIAAALVVAIVVLSTKYISRQQIPHSHSFAMDVIKCFCLKRNAKDLLEVRKNDLNSLHGIRFLSSFMIVFLHTATYAMGLTLQNGLDFEMRYQRYKPFVEFLVLAVEAFFVMSGLLFARNFDGDGSFRSLTTLILKRYFRLLWWYMATAIIIVFILPDTGCGVMCTKFMKYERNACVQSWWVGILMIGNIISSYEYCNPVTWYIFCDFHLTVVAAVLYWVHQRSRRLAIGCFSILTILSMIILGRFAYNNTYILKASFGFNMLEKLRITKDPFYLSFYMGTRYRAISYLVGLAVGYVMNIYGITAFYQPYFKKRFTIALVTSLALGISLMFIQVNENLMSALFLVMHKLVCAGIISALIIACESGSLPLVNEFLSCSLFIMPSKLSYGVYMIHSVVIIYTWLSSRTSISYNGYVFTEKLLGTYTLATMMSLFFFLFVEAPLNNLVKLLLTSRRQNKGFVDDSKGIGIVKNNDTSSSISCYKKEE
ncbi:O-acyltransferase like protein-like [Battus philenor]|uniref:O-acyltransferase like protein-like n=1 Tax=Battus philenor TaxID=42288 RepID=UPI0035CFFF31